MVTVAHFTVVHFNKGKQC